MEEAKDNLQNGNNDAKEDDEDETYDPENPQLDISRYLSPLVTNSALTLILSGTAGTAGTARTGTRTRTLVKCEVE